MRILAILALALLLASCQGNRLAGKQGMNVRQAQPTERSAVG
jgi:PBP1b-binding outer membrane lipoprotein LpoB